MTHTHFTPVDNGEGHAPMLGGGARCNLRDYARFLDMIAHGGVFQGERVLSVEAVRAMQADRVGRAQIPSDAFPEHVRGTTHSGIYGLGEWRETLDEGGNAVLISSPSWAGAYPWIDKHSGVYGFFLAHIDGPRAHAAGFSGFYASPVLAMMVRQAVLRAAVPPETKTGMVHIGDADLYYEEAGQGNPVILVHGHSLDRRMWDPQFTELSRHYRVIRYDCRGYGLSDMPEESTRFMHADDLSRLMQALHIEKAHLLGLSMGGFILIDMLALHQDQILSATLASGGVRNAEGPSTPIGDEEIRRRRSEIQALRERGVLSYKKEWYHALMRDVAPEWPAMPQVLWTMIGEWTAWQPLHIEPRLLLNRDAEPRLAEMKITVPVQVIEGGRDRGSLQHTVNVLEKSGAQIRRTVIERTGHMCNMERPEAFTRAVLRFLRESGHRVPSPEGANR